MLMIMKMGLRRVSSIFLLKSRPMSTSSFMAASSLGCQVAQRITGLLQEHVVERGLGELHRLQADPLAVQHPEEQREVARELSYAELYMTLLGAHLEHEVFMLEPVQQRRLVFLVALDANGDAFVGHFLLERLRSAFVDDPVSYTHLRAHETRHDLVCRLLLEKKKTTTTQKNK